MPVESSPPPAGAPQRLFGPQDAVWLVLFVALMATAFEPHPIERPLLAALAVFQILEPKFAFFQTTRGVASAALVKLSLSYLLIGYSGGVESGYYLLLLLPLVSTATALGPLGTAAFAVIASGAYLSFLLWIDWNRYDIPPDQMREILRRLTFFTAIGYLSHTLAAATREQAKRLRQVAEQLADANQSLREAEAAVRRSDRLAALGQLTAGLAHELRNPLGTIKASAEVLGKSLPEGNDVAREMAGFISTEVDRTNQLVTRFLEFARPLKLRLAAHDLSETIDLAIARIERGSPRYPVVFYRNYAPDIRPFVYDAELIERVFSNLLLNAAQSTPPGGEVTVKTRPLDSAVEVLVIDRGSGIDPKHREAIFNPFFTTKPDGVGLGLAIVSKVIDEHGGTMAVESEVGTGSVFRVYLPTTLAAPPPNESS